MRGQRMPTRTGNAFRGGLSLLVAACTAGCVPPLPPIYRYPPPPYIVSREPLLARKPVSLTGGLPNVRVACAPRPELTEADKAELFRQFDSFQKGGSLPTSARQTADTRPPCPASAETP